MKNLNLIAGGVWHLPFTASLFRNVKNVKKRVITSIPKRIYNQHNFSNLFVPKYSQIIQKLFKLKLNKKIRLIDDYQFSYLASKFINNGDLNWGWQGFLFNSMLKNYNGINILDRACPHINNQEEIKKEQCKILNLKYDPKSDYVYKRSYLEYEKSDFIVTTSNFSKNTFIKNGIDEKKIIKMPIINKINSFRLKNIKNEKITFGFIGGDICRKGIFYLLKAWKNADLKNANLIVKSNINELSKSSVLKELLKNQKNIKFVNYYPDISDFYNQIDILVFPSTDDGFGMVIPEALYFNKFVIASTNAGASELIVEGENGFTYDYKNIGTLTDIILLTAKNRQIISSKGKEHLLKTFENENKKSLNFIMKLQKYL